MTSDVIVEKIKTAVPPEALFRHAAKRRHLFFLDSALSSADTGRYSLLGWAPFLTVEAHARVVTIRHPGGTQVLREDPFAVLRRIVGAYRTPRTPEVPFAAGAVGYFGYDLGRQLEDLPAPSGRSPSPAPDLWLGFYGAAAVYDHLAGVAYACATGLHAGGGPPDPSLARERLGDLRQAMTAPGPPAGAVAAPKPPFSGRPRPVCTRASYLALVERVKEYIAAGDVYQVNLSQRFDAELRADPASVYARLRRINPAPFAGYVDTGDTVILSSSPERFLRLHGDAVETRPIKGTRRKEPGSADGERLRQELLCSEKDRAELVMIVDLERNDLGKVCRYGSVEVPDLIRVEEYATVLHLVATVQGRLRAGLGMVDCLAACFPGGSITGAPKVRAMQIIDELEPVARGPYTGAMGYLSFAGDADLNLLIRTLVVREGQVAFHVGAGIVADSDPRAEYAETLAKAEALIHCLRGNRRERDALGLL